MTDNFTQKNASKFYCEKCYFSCSKLSDWNRHITTRKHNNTYKILTSTDEKLPKNAISYECECGRSYKHRQSLYTHKKSCSIIQGEYNNTIIENDKSIDKQLLIKMLLKNQDVMEKMIEMMPNIGNNSHNNITNLSLIHISEPTRPY